MLSKMKTYSDLLQILLFTLNCDLQSDILMILCTALQPQTHSILYCTLAILSRIKNAFEHLVIAVPEASRWQKAHFQTI